jgi:hypothetical protein
MAVRREVEEDWGHRAEAMMAVGRLKWRRSARQALELIA